MNQPYGCGKLFSSFLSPEEEDQLEHESLLDHEQVHGALPKVAAKSYVGQRPEGLESSSCPGYWKRPSPREFKEQRDKDYLTRSYYKQQDGSLDKPGATLTDPFPRHGCRESFYLDRRQLHRDVRSYLVPQRIVKERYSNSKGPSCTTATTTTTTTPSDKQACKKSSTPLKKRTQRQCSSSDEDFSDGDNEPDQGSSDDNRSGTQSVGSESVNDDEEPAEETEEDWINRQRIYQARREGRTGRHATVYSKANGVESEESQFASFFSNAVFRHSAHFPASGFQAGSGRLSFGRHPKQKVDLTLFLKDAAAGSPAPDLGQSSRDQVSFKSRQAPVVFLANYHGTFFHRTAWNEDNRLDSMPITNGSEEPSRTDVKPAAPAAAAKHLTEGKVEHWFCPQVAARSLDFITEQFATDMIRSLEMAVIFDVGPGHGRAPSRDDLKKCIEEVNVIGLPINLAAESAGDSATTQTLLLRPQDVGKL